MSIPEVQRWLIKKRLDAAIFKPLGEDPDPTIQYLIGYDGHGVLRIPAKGEPILFVYSLEENRAKKIFKNTVVSRDPFKEALKGRRLGLEVRRWTVPEFKLHKLSGRVVDLTPEVRVLRAIKSKKEINKLSFVAKQTSKIFEDLLKQWKNFKTESDVAAWIDYQIKKRGGEPSFPTIVASGKNAAMPHYTPQRKKLQRGFCVLDFGMKYQGYCADMTRTIFIGKPKEQDCKYYGKVFAAQEAAYQKIKSDTPTKTLHEIAITTLGDDAKYFIHALGHGIGLEVHESPRVSMNAEDILKENMIITLEPGIYIPNRLGIRIEDMFLVTKNGSKKLTTAPRRMICVK